MSAADESYPRVTSPPPATRWEPLTGGLPDWLHTKSFFHLTRCFTPSS